MNYEFQYPNGRTRVFATMEAFCAALPRKRPTTEAIIWTPTRNGSGGSLTVETAQEARDVTARFEAEAQALRLTERRPLIWAERRPEAMAAHMERRPAGYPRAAWAMQITDQTLDDEQTVEEQVATIRQSDPQRYEAHMAQRPANFPRPEWARRLVAEPAGGYNAYKTIVEMSGR